MTTLEDAKATALNWIESHPPWLSDFHQEIWRYAEPAYRCSRWARACGDLLRRHGFTAEEGSGGMPTAFPATWGQVRDIASTLTDLLTRPDELAKAPGPVPEARRQRHRRGPLGGPAAARGFPPAGGPAGPG